MKLLLLSLFVCLILASESKEEESNGCGCTFHQRGGMSCSCGGASYSDSSAYAGDGNPDHQCVRSVGPLPRGSWSISNGFYDPRRGNPSFTLSPHGGTCGRSGFMIHAQGRTEGCICATQGMRQFIQNHGIHYLSVQ